MDILRRWGQKGPQIVSPEQADDGQLDTLGVTGFHKFYSQTRGWESVDSLLPGEVLRTQDEKK